MFDSKDRPPRDAARAGRLADSPAPFRTPANLHSQVHPPCFQQLAHSLALTKAANIAASTTCALFNPRQDSNPSVSIYFRTLRALLCKSSTLNSFAFKCVRTLSQKRRGWGTPPEITTFHNAVFPGSARPSQRVSIVSQTLSKRSIRPIETLRFTCGLYPRIFAPLALPTQEAISPMTEAILVWPINLRVK